MDAWRSANEKAEIRRRKAAIRRQIKREVLAEFGLDKLPNQGDRKLVTGAQGTGKSRETAAAIAELPPGAVIWWTVPTLDKAEEQIAEYRRLATAASMSSMVVRGRGAGDPQQTGEAMCPRHRVVNRAAALGVDVQKDICDGGCSLLRQCGFQRQSRALKDNPTGLFLMASDYLWLPCPAPQPHLLVIDEAVVGKAAETLSFDPSRITDDQKWAGGQLVQAMERRRIALLVRAALTEHPGRELAFLRDSGVSVDDLKACTRHLATREEAQPQLHGHMSDKTIAAILDAVEARETRKVLKLFRQIRRELRQPRARLNSVWFDPNARVRVGNEIERQPRVYVGYIKALRIRNTVPMLALDGTGSLAFNQKIFGDHMTAERFPVPRDAEVYQVSTKFFSRQSLTGTDRQGTPRSPAKVIEAERLRAQVLELLQLLPGDVLLVTYKAAEEVLRDDLPEHVEVTHFGALRGLNSYEHCETAVVMGREQPSAEAIEALTRPFTTTDAEPFIPIGEYILQSRGRRMRNGGPNVVEVQVHPDPRCQEMLEQVREAEILQAIDRVWPVFNRRKIIVLTNLALDLTVDQVMPWSELRPSKFAHAFARHGVLPLSAGDLCRGFPDLWPTKKEAENALGYAARNTLKTSNRCSIGNIQGVFQGMLRRTYRRKGQRGPLAHVLVRADLPNPRSVLEGLVGELVEFHVEQTPQPPAQATAPQPLPQLPPLAAAMSAEAHLLATLQPDARPPDLLGMARVMQLVAWQRDEQRAAA
jgi:hypothetical protein